MKNPVIRLVDVYSVADAAAFLYALLRERRPEESIAHRETPTMEQHRGFMLSLPYRAWYLIDAGERPQQAGPQFVGACNLRNNNEIGVGILRAFQRRGFARAALLELMRLHEPLPAIAATRPGRFVANVNPANAASVAFFSGLGRHIANTYEL
jgi:RimJ/RimL family protein N-acetyltransferase